MSIYQEAENFKQKLREEKPLRIAFFGQPGAGKSSLINKFLGKNKAVVNVTTDTTTDSTEYNWGELVITDLPGYGTSRFPKESYWEKFDIKSFNIFLCIFEGKFKKEDTEFFAELEKQGRVCLFVRNKNDQIWQEGKSYEDLVKDIVNDVRKQVAKQVKVFFTSCKDNFGISSLQDAIYEQLDEANKDRWARNSAAFSETFLEKKKKACKGIVLNHAVLAAGNALNPIPGTDVSIDIGIILQLFESIKQKYGLSDEKIKGALEKQILFTSANNIIKFASKEGLMTILKKMVGRVAIKQFSKYIPMVGQAVASSLGFAMVKLIGDDYVDDCHLIAENILKEELSIKRPN